jgi:ATP-dependent Clp endopeptidase proteolytic subunit ClpP
VFFTHVNAAGKKGKRYALSHTSIMLHHPTGVARGQASDVHNEGRELLRVRDYMDATLSVATGRSFYSIQNDLERALYMSPHVRLLIAAALRAVCCTCFCCMRRAEPFAFVC